MTGPGTYSRSRVATEAELAAILDVHAGQSVSVACERHGATVAGVSNMIQSRFGGVKALRGVPNASELEVIRHVALNAREFWARIGVDQPSAAPEKPAETYRRSPFPVSSGGDHHDDPLARVRSFRDGVGPFRYRDLTGALLGDPPVGRSALDHRRDRPAGSGWRDLRRPEPVSGFETAAALRQIAARARPY